MLYRVCNAYHLGNCFLFDVLYSIPQKRLYCSQNGIKDFYEEIIKQLESREEDIEPDTLKQIAVAKCIENLTMGLKRFVPINYFIYTRRFYDGTKEKTFCMSDSLLIIKPLDYDSLESAFLDITKNPYFKDSRIDDNLISILPNNLPIVDRYVTNYQRCGNTILKIMMMIIFILARVVSMYISNNVGINFIIGYSVLVFIMGSASIVYYRISAKHRESLNPKEPMLFYKS